MLTAFVALSRHAVSVFVTCSFVSVVSTTCDVGGRKFVFGNEVEPPPVIEDWVI